MKWLLQRVDLQNCIQRKNNAYIRCRCRYKKSGTDLVVIGGKEYGTGSSRDWAAKGTKL